MPKFGVIPLQTSKSFATDHPSLWELGAIGVPGGIGMTAIVEPGQSSVRPAVSCSIEGPLGGLAARAFENFRADWSERFVTAPNEFDVQARPANDDPNIADLPSPDADVDQLSKTRLDLVTGRFSCLVPGKDTGGLVNRSTTIAWLPPQSSSSSSERQTNFSKELDSDAVLELARFMLSCDSVLILTSAATPPTPPRIERIVQAFSHSAYLAESSNTYPRERVNLSRVIFGIADCGFPFANAALQRPLASVTSEEMYDWVVGPSMRTIGNLLRETRRLKEKFSPSAKVEILAAPFDLFGDISSRGILNRDLAEPKVALIRPRDFSPDQRLDEPGTYWNTFNIADPYIIAATGALSKMCFDLT